MYAEIVQTFLAETGAVCGMCFVAVSIIYTVGSMLKAKLTK